MSSDRFSTVSRLRIMVPISFLSRRYPPNIRNVSYWLDIPISNKLISEVGYASVK